MLADWVVNRVQTVVVGRNGERLLYSLRVKIFAHLQRLGLDFYERELTGRIMTRMTTDVDALSSFLQTGLITMVSSVLTFVGVLVALLFINLRLGLALFPILPVLIVATVVFRMQVVAGLHARPGSGSAWSTPTCRRTWPGCGSPRPTGASR